jgi:hypothetical protein
MNGTGIPLHRHHHRTVHDNAHILLHREYVNNTTEISDNSHLRILIGMSQLNKEPSHGCWIQAMHFSLLSLTRLQVPSFLYRLQPQSHCTATLTGQWSRRTSTPSINAASWTVSLPQAFHQNAGIPLNRQALPCAFNAFIIITECIAFTLE